MSLKDRRSALTAFQHCTRLAENPQDLADIDDLEGLFESELPTPRELKPYEGVFHKVDPYKMVLKLSG